MKKFNILIIDDNAESRASLHEMLIANDFVVKSVSSQKEGLALSENESLDLIFIESAMAGREGYKACESFKSDKKLKGMPVIFIVGSNELMIVNEIFEAGGDDYVTRPFVWSEVMNKTRTHLELKYSREMSKNMNQILEAKVAQRTIELEDSLKKLGQAKKELELLSIAKIEFLNLISHEIRTPLNGILGSLALIGRYNFTDEVNRYISLLDTSVKRLERFSNTILEASTLRLKGEQALVMTQIDLAKIIKSAISQCASKFSAKEIDLLLLNEATSVILKGDHKYLLKCFTAIIDNAYKFSHPKGKVEIRIANETKGLLNITITDNGKGFSKAAMESIYTPLGNLEAHFDQNTGMGLHLAKLILDAHSGFISAGNHGVKGAIIEIKIPTRI